MKKLCSIVMAIVIAGCLLIATACNSGGSSEEDNKTTITISTVEEAYALAQELGYTGTLDEFIITIKGEQGATGNGIADISTQTGTDENGSYTLITITFTDGSDSVTFKVYDGADGNSGSDGITPIFKLENGVLYVSYDEGSTWEAMGNTQGEQGKAGTGIYDITVNEQGELIIILTDETEINCGKIYCVHNYGDWEELIKTCTTHWQVRICSDCGDTQIRSAEITGHNYIDGICTVCGEIKGSKGLAYTLNDDGETYYVSGIGTCTDEEIIIPVQYNGKSVTGIGANAFYNCSFIKSITFGTNIETLGRYAFNGCSQLTEVFYEGDIAGWSSIEFYSEDVVFFYKYDLYFNGELVENVVFPESVTQVSPYIFNSCKSIINVTLSTETTDIGEYAFQNCINLKSITFNDKLKSVGAAAFSGCAALIEAELPNSVISLGYGAFTGCNSLANLTIGTGIETIENLTFYGCKSLTTVVIPANVKSIGQNAFEYCPNLVNVTFENTNGWYVYTSSTPTSGTSISSTDLSDTSTAATYLTSTYYSYYWKCS